MGELVHANDLDIIIRRPRLNDQSYVASTWARSLMDGDRSLSMRDANELVDRMCNSKLTQVLIACEPTRTDVILGWIAYTALPRAVTLHYVYAREKHRGRGVGAALWAEITKPHGRDLRKVIYTLRGPALRWLAEKYPHAIHLPVEEFLAP